MRKTQRRQCHPLPTCAIKNMTIPSQGLVWSSSASVAAGGGVARGWPGRRQVVSLGLPEAEPWEPGICQGNLSHLLSHANRPMCPSPPPQLLLGSSTLSSVKPCHLFLNMALKEGTWLGVLTTGSSIARLSWLLARLLNRLAQVSGSHTPPSLASPPPPPADFICLTWLVLALPFPASPPSQSGPGQASSSGSRGAGDRQASQLRESGGAWEAETWEKSSQSPRARTTPRPGHHGGDGAAETGSGAAQEADCCNPRALILGTPENRAQDMWECGLGGVGGLGSLLGDSETLDLDHPPTAEPHAHSCVRCMCVPPTLPQPP
nr:guanine nucleotide-binding protein G(I)/G(S)/G(T) subunit beta-3 isoform X3 [Peromyscus maniculatus bairdii]